MAFRGGRRNWLIKQVRMKTRGGGGTPPEPPGSATQFTQVYIVTVIVIP